jgi:NAD-dependent deacetylase
MPAIEQFTDHILHSNYPVFFTGAGISTNSGIPDFRGPKGFWKTNTPIMFQDFMSQESMRMKYWTQSIEFKSNFQEKIPNEGHSIISEVINSKKAGHCITQNVDNLHQQSGLDDASVTELHGNATFAVCLDCKKRFELSFIHEEFKSINKPPKCDSCNGWIKTATISFGQPMPEDKMIIAHEETLKADVFIVAGSSLSVFPAANFPLIAKENDAKLLIVNNEETQFDNFADVLIHDDISKTFSNLKTTH